MYSYYSNNSLVSRLLPVFTTEEPGDEATGI